MYLFDSKYLQNKIYLQLSDAEISEKNILTSIKDNFYINQDDKGVEVHIKT